MRFRFEDVRWRLTRLTTICHERPSDREGRSSGTGAYWIYVRIPVTSRHRPRARRKIVNRFSQRGYQHLTSIARKQEIALAGLEGFMPTTLSSDESKTRRIFKVVTGNFLEMYDFLL